MATSTTTKPPIYDAAHPEYRPALELLATLPKSPCHATVGNLRNDLGLTFDKLEYAVRELRETYGVFLVVKRNEGFRPVSVGITPASWGRAQRTALDYWERVNGRPTP